jgi:hypothetical protein
MSAARAVYVTKCARCHKFYNPARYADAEWRDWMDKMSRKAGLKPAQKELLSRYLDVYRTAAKTNASLALPAPGLAARVPGASPVGQDTPNAAAASPSSPASVATERQRQIFSARRASGRALRG